MEEEQMMDENTSMMIQLASMMMQNQSAIRETQSQLEAANVTKAHASGRDADDTHVNGAGATIPTVSSLSPFGMDPKLMAEFARQIVMNANKTSGDQKKGPHKPTTIAQMMQVNEGQMATATSEGKIFVYNKIPDVDENLSPTVTLGENIKVDPSLAQTTYSSASNGAFSLPKESKRSSSVGPIRNRYGRVLRPGIDNYGQFEAVANHGLIMQAMELLRQKDKKKRGPKEKDTFSVFMYCLPDKNSKLPKFSSLDPVERALVDQHQQEGFGYPEIDYINGIPRKTQLCLSYDESKFHNYMVSLYPKLEGRLYDMYRIDKTRRLIRVEAKSPRQLKDMKYQGSLIVIPYDKSEERPAPIIHRNFDDVYSGNGTSSQPLGNPLSLIQNFNIPLPCMPEAHSPESAILTKTKSREPVQSTPVFPGVPVGQKPQKVTQKLNGTVAETDDTARINGSDDVFANVKLLTRAAQARGALKSTKNILVRQESIFHDLMNAYRDDENLESHKISVVLQDDNDPQSQEEVAFGSLLTMFWEEALKKHFTGNHHLVPVLDSLSGEDLFQILGRVLGHGLIHENYVPLRLSPACLSFILANTCSYQLSLSSFYQVMSKTEREVLLAALAEAKLCVECFSPRVERSLKTVLGSYGCKSLPPPYELDGCVPSIARSFLMHQPYWALCQIQETFCQSELDIAGITEDDIMHLYKVLSYDVPSILQRTVYVYSKSDDLEATEQKVKVAFEEYLHKLPNIALQKILHQWCGYDCLCAKQLFVTFTGDQELGKMFNQRESTLTLPSSCTAVDEISQLVSSHITIAAKMDTDNNWEYTL